MALHNPFEGCPEGFHVSGLALVIVLGAKMGEPILKTQKISTPSGGPFQARQYC